MATACLYCRLQLPHNTEFCPECGRPIESDFEIRPLQPSKWDPPGKEMEAKDNLQHKTQSYPVEASSRVGRAKKKVAPSPSADSNQMRPPCRSTSSRQRYSPKPVPPIP